MVALIELLKKANASSLSDFWLRRVKPEPLEFFSVACLLAILGKNDAAVRAQLVESGAVAAIIRLMPRVPAFEDRSLHAKYDARGAAFALSCLLDCDSTANAQSHAAPIVEAGGVDALLSLAKYGTLVEAECAVDALKKLIQTSRIEAPSPWPKTPNGFYVSNPWMDPDRRAIIYPNG